MRFSTTPSMTRVDCGAPSRSSARPREELSRRRVTGLPGLKVTVYGSEYHRMYTKIDWHDIDIS
jgi:hypothetical protein